jgi:16S rRNA (cytidine1402-2'-O)-methyltransferase
MNGSARTPHRGRLYLVPNLLGAVPPEHVLPARTIAIARELSHFVVETAKPARAFLKALAPTRAMQDIAMHELGDDPSVERCRALLAPALDGHDMGLVSDAGCPGVADPGARLVAAAHAARVTVVPLVGPSSLLLALMASGMNGQAFAFHGYLPVKPDARVAAIRTLEAASRRTGAAQLFIETPYRNAAMIEALCTACSATTRLAVAADLTLETEEVAVRAIGDWRKIDAARYAKRPAIFIVQAYEK